MLTKWKDTSEHKHNPTCNFCDLNHNPHSFLANITLDYMRYCLLWNSLKNSCFQDNTKVSFFFLPASLESPEAREASNSSNSCV